MSGPNDGGNAFPEHHYFDMSRGSHGEHMTASRVGCGGMTLRAYMATKFMAAILSNPASYTESGTWRNESETAAEEAVNLADSLIEELSK